MSAFLVADKIENDADGKVILTGSAEVRRIDSVVKGDRIDYQRETGQVNVLGNGMIMRDGSIVEGPELHFNVNSDTGQVNDPNFWLGATGGAGKAAKADILSRSKMRLSDVTYSGCPCPDPAWYITSSRVDLDFAENEGVARNGVLFFKGVPILASPYLSFPITKDRKSGFLIPTYGMSSNSGFEFSLPYYFNLAPNYDMTLTPRYLSKRGTQLGGEFRYLGKSYSGQFTGTYLPSDAVTNEKRWMYSAQHYQRLGGGFNASYDVRGVSDDNYFRDFSTFGLNEATTTYLPRVATLGWGGYKYWNAHVQAYTYQTLQDETGGYLIPPYDKLPELYVRGARYNWGGFDVASNNYATKFRMPDFKDATRSYGSVFGDYSRYPNQSYEGTRFSSYTTVAYPIVRSGWYVTPKAGLHLSQYNTDWNGFSLPPDTVTGSMPTSPRTESRVLPVLSLDSGMTFERRTRLFGNDSIQTLEPRAYYLYVPYTDQSQLPVFDTGIASFNFSQAFDENLFSGGWDRIANANQLTLGLTTRWLDEGTGFERLSLSAAQRIYFDDQRVTLPYQQPRRNKKSDYLVGADAAVTDKLNVRFDAQFNPESNDRNRMTAGLRWKPKRLASLSAAYRYERDPAQVQDPAIVRQRGYVDNSREQVTLSGQWPLTNRIYALGRVDYSLQEKRSTQTIVGLEYKGDCCWTARTVFQRYAVSAQDVNTAIFFQLELSGLGSLGTDPMGLLGRTIPTYENVMPPIPQKTTFERYE
ncbi:MAG TPA: LPS-assembly protein LptD [Eoetvoesiella sp.]